MGVQICFLPECFSHISRNQEESLKLSEKLEGDSIQKYQNLAKSLKIWLSLGGFQQKQDQSQKLLNTHLIIDDKGEIVEKYNKLHLFDIKLDKQNQVRESNSFDYGDKLPNTVDFPVGKLGLSICYDIRFPELYRFLANQGQADILLVPSAFFKVTGKAVWHTLLKARAIENQCFVIAAAQVGKHNEKRESYGHSLVVDPNGKVILDMGSQNTGLEVIEIHLDQIKNTRNTVPAFYHQRFLFSSIIINQKPKY